jgi:hypothetical protein
MTMFYWVSAIERGGGFVRKVEWNCASFTSV